MSKSLRDLKNINFDKTKETTKESIQKILSQAKESIKVLEALQKEGIAKAKTFIPSREDTKYLTSEKITSSFKKLGLATRDEVNELERKVEALASELRTQITKIKKSNKKELD